MAVGLNAPGNLLAIKGIELATAPAGIRYAERDDMLLIHCHQDTTIAGVFTLNKFCAAPVTLAKQHLPSARSLLINSGNANAGTGDLGMQNALESCRLMAQSLGLQEQQVLPFSTGVIGEQLPMDKVEQGIAQLSSKLSEDNWLAAAKAIMTTDTVAKACSNTVEIDGQTISVTGIAKGSGMICPNMATMLAYVACDAKIDSKLLQEMLDQASAASFNRITVDGDTSTNDALMLMASGQTDVSLIDSMDDPRAQILYHAIEKICVELACSVIRDAEGATKFIRIEVVGGCSENDCEQVAYTVAHSPLVKTALFASDPNWGRILAAVGRAPITDLEIDKISIDIGSGTNQVSLIKSGQPAKGYTEQQGKDVFSQQEITIRINLGLAEASYHVWTSDLSHDYVSINADYRS